MARHLMRKILGLGVCLLAAGCAAKPAPVPPPAPVAPSLPKPPSAPPPPDFNGLSTDALRARLGAPAFSRGDGPTLIWRYDGTRCRTFFFFTGGLVSHIDTIPAGPGNGPDPDCLKSLQKTF